MAYDNRRHRTLDERLDCIENLLLRLLNQEEDMAANESAEATALATAIEGLNTEIADVGAVDAEVVVDLEGVKGALEKVQPTSPEQVNAITAATTSLASLTAKLKAAGSDAATVEAGAGTPPAPPAEPAEPAPPVDEAKSVTTPPAEGNTPAE